MDGVYCMSANVERPRRRWKFGYILKIEIGNRPARGRVTSVGRHADGSRALRGSRRVDVKQHRLMRHVIAELQIVSQPVNRGVVARGRNGGACDIRWKACGGSRKCEFRGSGDRH